jgi:hypothetical protein
MEREVGMSGMVGAAAVVAEVDPTVQPVRSSFYVFLFLAAMLAVLLFSLVRHLRRANQNLGSARQAPGEAGPGTSAPLARAPEDDVR